jgi:hypothetical protein
MLMSGRRDLAAAFTAQVVFSRQYVDACGAQAALETVATGQPDGPGLSFLCSRALVAGEGREGWS